MVRFKKKSQVIIKSLNYVFHYKSLQKIGVGIKKNIVGHHIGF